MRMPNRKSHGPRYFPHPDSAGPYGQLTIDNRLDTERLLDAYRHGIFPWPSQSASAQRSGRGRWSVGWYSPNPRAILPLDAVRFPKRLGRKLRSGQFRFLWDRHFDVVLEHCATIGTRKRDRWLSPELMQQLMLLNRLKYAHSIEVFHAKDGFHSLCGGLYGIAIGKTFAAESMFHLSADASKAALLALVKLLQVNGYQLLDIQQLSPHTVALGAIEIPRSEFLRLLSDARQLPTQWPDSPELPLRLDAIENCRISAS